MALIPVDLQARGLNRIDASIYVYEELLNSRDKNVFAMSLAMTVVGVVMLYFANRLTNRLQVLTGGAADLPERCCQAVLLPVGGELLQDE